MSSPAVSGVRVVVNTIGNAASSSASTPDSMVARPARKGTGKCPNCHALCAYAADPGCCNTSSHSKLDFKKV